MDHNIIMYIIQVNEKFHKLERGYRDCIKRTRDKYTVYAVYCMSLSCLLSFLCNPYIPFLISENFHLLVSFNFFTAFSSESYSHIISSQYVPHFGDGISQIEWKLKFQFSHRAKIGQNDHSNPYIESTTVLSGTLHLP